MAAGAAAIGVERSDATLGRPGHGILVSQLTKHACERQSQEAGDERQACTGGVRKYY
jgi:hypothetical protein